MTDDQVALFEKMKPSSVTIILAKKGQNPTLIKAKYDFKTHLDRFPRVNIVHYDSFFIILRPLLTSEAMMHCASDRSNQCPNKARSGILPACIAPTSGG